MHIEDMRIQSRIAEIHISKYKPRPSSRGALTAAKQIQQMVANFGSLNTVDYCLTIGLLLKAGNTSS
jgi:hypothetical protein